MLVSPASFPSPTTMEFPGFSLLIAALCLGLSLLYLAVFFVRRYQALSHVPGPRLAAWTDFWLHYKYRSNVNAKQLYRDLRKQYGPTFRYGPNRVMFSDIAAVPIIYGTTNVFEKVRPPFSRQRSSAYHR